MGRVVECHHWSAAQVWAKLPGTPFEVADFLITSWNNPPQRDEEIDYPFITYPQTPQFRYTLANLIQAAREKSRDGEVKIIADGYGDDLCRACQRCNRRFLP